MKKILYVIVTIVAILGMSGCGNKVPAKYMSGLKFGMSEAKAEKIASPLYESGSIKFINVPDDNLNKLIKEYGHLEELKYDDTGRLCEIVYHFGDYDNTQPCWKIYEAIGDYIKADLPKSAFDSNAYHYAWYIGDIIITVDPVGVGVSKERTELVITDTSVRK